jgi:hypothetical protein
MIYIIISNVGLAIMMLLVYFRYSHFRISTAIEIKKLRQECLKLKEEVKEDENKIFETTKFDAQKIEDLLREIDELRKEKEIEIKLRLNAEKQIDITLEKMRSLEKTMQDWSLMQDAVMKDSKEAILKVGNDLYRKLSDNYQQEVEINKNLIGRVSKNFSEFFEKFSKNDINSKPETKHLSNQHNFSDSEDVISRQLISDLVETMKAGGRAVNKDYFLPSNFDDRKANLMLCEIVFIDSEILNILDFKACRYLAEYNKIKEKNVDEAVKYLQQKLDKYFAYLSNLKYRDSILKVMSYTKVKFSKAFIKIIVPSSADLKILKDLHYYEKARQIGLEVLDYDGVNDLVL